MDDDLQILLDVLNKVRDSVQRPSRYNDRSRKTFVDLAPPPPEDEISDHEIDILDIDDGDFSEYTRRQAELMNYLKKTVGELRKHKDAASFLDPIDYKLLQCEDYETIVSHPMNLNDIYRRIPQFNIPATSGAGGREGLPDGTTYESLLTEESVNQPDLFHKPESVLEAVHRVWDNCYLYNKPELHIVKWAKNLQRLFADRLSKMVDKGYLEDEAIEHAKESSLYDIFAAKEGKKPRWFIEERRKRRTMQPPEEEDEKTTIKTRGRRVSLGPEKYEAETFPRTNTPRKRKIEKKETTPRTPRPPHDTPKEKRTKTQPPTIQPSQYLQGPAQPGDDVPLTQEQINTLIEGMNSLNEKSMEILTQFINKVNGDSGRATDSDEELEYDLDEFSTHVQHQILRETLTKEGMMCNLENHHIVVEPVITIHRPPSANSLKELLKLKHPIVQAICINFLPFADLPDLSSAFPNLFALKCHLSQLSEIPSSLSRVRHLTFLDLSFTTITQFPRFEIPTLTHLTLVYCGLTDISHDLQKHFPKLQHLSVQKNHLTTLPPISHDSLIFLSTDSNHLKSVMTQLHLPKLTHLGLFNNQITDFLLPKGSNLSQLQSLFISNNSLITLTSQISYTNPKLIDLDASSNALSVVPFSIVLSSYLSTLFLHDNNICYSPHLLFDGCPVYITLRNNLLSVLPKLGKSVSVVSANRNRIRFVDCVSLSVFIFSAIPAQSDLFTLSLSHNCLTHFPRSIFSTRLVYLFLGHNFLRSVPLTLGKMTTLTKLDLSFNQLDHVPSAIFFLTNLSSLNLSFNCITSLPPWLFILPNLRALFLAGNMLSSLPNKKTILQLLEPVHITLPSIYSLGYYKMAFVEYEELLRSHWQEDEKWRSLFIDENGVDAREKATNPKEFAELVGVDVVNEAMLELTDSELAEAEQNAIKCELETTPFISMPTPTYSTPKFNQSSPDTQFLPKVILPSKGSNPHFQRPSFSSIVSSLPLSSAYLHPSVSPIDILVLSSNHFPFVPNAISLFTSLSTLNLSDNCIETVPSDLFIVHPRLSRLDLSFNRITSLSPNFLSKTSAQIVYFDISHNFIQELPSRLTKPVWEEAGVMEQKRQEYDKEDKRAEHSKSHFQRKMKRRYLNKGDQSAANAASLQNCQFVPNNTNRLTFLQHRPHSTSFTSTYIAKVWAGKHPHTTPPNLLDIVNTFTTPVERFQTFDELLDDRILENARKESDKIIAERPELAPDNTDILPQPNPNPTFFLNRRMLYLTSFLSVSAPVTPRSEAGVSGLTGLPTNLLIRSATNFVQPLFLRRVDSNAFRGYAAAVQRGFEKTILPPPSNYTKPGASPLVQNSQRMISKGPQSPPPVHTTPSPPVPNPSPEAENQKTNPEREQISPPESKLSLTTVTTSEGLDTLEALGSEDVSRGDEYAAVEQTMTINAPTDSSSTRSSTVDSPSATPSKKQPGAAPRPKGDEKELLRYVDVSFNYVGAIKLNSEMTNKTSSPVRRTSPKDGEGSQDAPTDKTDSAGNDRPQYQPLKLKDNFSSSLTYSNLLFLSRTSTLPYLLRCLSSTAHFSPHQPHFVLSGAHLFESEFFRVLSQHIEKNEFTPVKRSKRSSRSTRSTSLKTCTTQTSPIVAGHSAPNPPPSIQPTFAFPVHAVSSTPPTSQPMNPFPQQHRYNTYPLSDNLLTSNTPPSSPASFMMSPHPLHSFPHNLPPISPFSPSQPTHKPLNPQSQLSIRLNVKSSPVSPSPTVQKEPPAPTWQIPSALRLSVPEPLYTPYSLAYTRKDKAGPPLAAPFDFESPNFVAVTLSHPTTEDLTNEFKRVLEPTTFPPLNLRSSDSAYDLSLKNESNQSKERQEPEKHTVNNVLHKLNTLIGVKKPSEHKLPTMNMVSPTISKTPQPKSQKMTIDDSIEPHPKYKRLFLGCENVMETGICDHCERHIPLAKFEAHSAVCAYNQALKSKTTRFPFWTRYTLAYSIKTSRGIDEDYSEDDVDLLRTLIEREENHGGHLVSPVNVSSCDDLPNATRGRRNASSPVPFKLILNGNGKLTPETFQKARMEKMRERMSRRHRFESERSKRNKRTLHSFQHPPQSSRSEIYHAQTSKLVKRIRNSNPFPQPKHRAVKSISNLKIPSVISIASPAVKSNRPLSAPSSTLNANPVQEQVPQCQSPPPLLPTLHHHNVAVAETCGPRMAMEDNVVLLPCGGWDLEALIDHFEIEIISTLLQCPQELRFTEIGMDALNKECLRLWKTSYAKKHGKDTPLPQKCPYYNSDLNGNGIFGIVDGHRTGLVSNYVWARFIPAFLHSVELLKKESEIEAARNTAHVEHETARFRTDNIKKLPPSPSTPTKRSFPNMSSSYGLNPFHPTPFGAISPEDASAPSFDHLPSFIPSPITPRANKAVPSVQTPEPIQTPTLMRSPSNPFLSSPITPTPSHPRSINPNLDILHHFTSHSSDDGHCQHSVRVSQSPLLLRALHATLDILIQSVSDDNVAAGAVMCVCALTPTRVFTANIGDCRAVLLSRFFDSSLSPTKATYPDSQSLPRLRLPPYDFCPSSRAERFTTSTMNPNPPPTFTSNLREMQPIHPYTAKNQQTEMVVEEHAACPSCNPLVGKPDPTLRLRHPIFTPDKHALVFARNLTNDHRPCDPRERAYLHSIGGFVNSDGRVNGVLMPSRGIGDLESKPMVSSDVDVFCEPIQRWKGIHLYPSIPTPSKSPHSQNSLHSLHQARLPHNVSPYHPNVLLSPSSFTLLPHTSSIPEPLIPLLSEYLKPPVPYSSPIHPNDPPFSIQHSFRPFTAYTPFIAKESSSTLNHTTASPSQPPPSSQPHPNMLGSYHPHIKFHNHTNHPHTVPASLPPHPPFSVCSITEGTLPVVTNVWKREDVALVIGCDGIFDVLDTQDLAELACPWMDSSGASFAYQPYFSRKQTQSFSENTSGSCFCSLISKGEMAEMAATRIRNAASALESQDNISVLVRLVSTINPPLRGLLQTFLPSF
ncbi:putative Leucine-rich repeat protein SHOC-2 [Blattamonas nauphoetae]|uniref:Leucine-rich repeat protein SHOC-2 n=1 Tax=Blattamonas nauphoetae TaxID=2049346 RepID=A0ABQ9XR15_9EUKA|nr:putative Leucine-rich repeat protein SHOC-2 [Blattamonas nauphoetae]